MIVYQPVDVVCSGAAIKLHVPAGCHGLVSELASSFDAGAEAMSGLELHACFLEHCAPSNEAAAVAVLEAMCRKYGVPDTNIHVAIQQHGLDEGAAQRVLRAYYQLWNVQDAQRCYFAAEKPALLASDAARPMAIFGGHPGSTAYLAEARWLLDVYRPLIGDYVSRMAAFLSDLARDERLEPAYEEGLDVLRWLAHPSSEPEYEYLVSAPVSIPLVELTQLMHIMVLYKTLGVSP
ncbi:hypothetical protein H4R18_005902, partial [Coemansia javaensis]